MNFKRLFFFSFICLSLTGVTVVGVVRAYQFRFGIGTLSGHVEYEGYPVRDAKITLIRSGKTFKATTNKSGDFRISGLDFGGYDVTVDVPWYESQTKTAVITPTFMETSVDFVLQLQVPSGDPVFGKIKGTVRDRNDHNLAGARIEIVDRRTGKPYKVAANDLGFYERDTLIPSRYRVTATADGYQKAVKSAKLGVRAIKEVNFQLPKSK